MRCELRVASFRSWTRSCPRQPNGQSAGAMISQLSSCNLERRTFLVHRRPAAQRRTRRGCQICGRRDDGQPVVGTPLRRAGCALDCGRWSGEMLAESRGRAGQAKVICAADVRQSCARDRQQVATHATWFASRAAVNSRAQSKKELVLVRWPPPSSLAWPGLA